MVDGVDSQLLKMQMYRIQTLIDQHTHSTCNKKQQSQKANILKNVLVMFAVVQTLS